MANSNLTAARLRELLSFDELTGIFTWRESRSSRRAGDPAGCLDYEGYRVIRVESKTCRAHRLAWLYVYGKWPDDQIDHINGLRDDNRLANLRDVTRFVNAQNKRTTRAKTASGRQGVTPDKYSDKWVAKLFIDGKVTVLGKFDDIDCAEQAYLAAKRTHHIGCAF